MRSLERAAVGVVAAFVAIIVATVELPQQRLQRRKLVRRTRRLLNAIEQTLIRT